jgi:hypothetical protein
MTLLFATWVGFFNWDPFKFALSFELLGVDAFSLFGDLLLFLIVFKLVKPEILLGVTSGGLKFYDVDGLWLILPFF